MVDKPIKLCVMGAAISPHVYARAKVFGGLGYDVHLITPTNAPANNSLDTDHTGFGPGLVGKIKTICKTLKLLNSERADLYHAHYAAEYGTWLAALLKKRPFIVTVMGGDVLFGEQGSLGPLGRWLTVFSLKRADLITAKSQSLADCMVKLGVARDKIKIVYWGVEPDLFLFSKDGRKKVRENWGAADGQKVIYCPRMLQPLYNQHLLIGALPDILKAQPNTILVLSTLGEDAAYGKRMRELVVEKELQASVKFVPAVSRDEMAAVYSAADLIAAIPSSDGMPQSTLEAMACERPVLMTNLERYKELFSHQQNAWFCDLSEEEIAINVAQLLGDEALTSALASQGKATVMAKANFDNEAERVNGYFQDLIQGRAS